MIYDFRWDQFNDDKIDKHGLSRDEVEFVVEHARKPYPEPLGNDAYRVIGPTRKGKVIQVLYSTEDDYETIYVYHARPRTEKERHRDRRNRRRRP